MLQHIDIQNVYREFDHCRNYITANNDSSLGAPSMKVDYTENMSVMFV